MHVAWLSLVFPELEVVSSSHELTIYQLVDLPGGVKYLLRGILFKLADGAIGPYESSDEAAGVRTIDALSALYVVQD